MNSDDAVDRGQTGIVRQLPDRGADVNAREGELNALYAAACEGSTEIVQLLLDRGADINAQGGEYGNALQAAVHEKQAGIVQLLLNRDADVNAQGGYYGNALQAAAYNRSTEIVQLLLDKGADANAQGGAYGTALHAAAHEGSTEIMQLLLDRGADINAQGGEYGNALQAAAGEGRIGAVRLLLDRGADINSHGGYYGNALQAASHEGQRKIVQLLLARHADINAQGGEYGNALQAAAHEGSIEIVQRLLYRGADVNAQGGAYGNALQAAAREGEIEIVRRLLNRGADVNAQGGAYGNALQAAACGWSIEIVQLLLDSGADVNAQGGTYGNPLQAAAARNGRTNIMRLLVNKHADVNAQDTSGQTPLHVAVEADSLSAATELLERDARTSIRDFRGATPLQLATQKRDYRYALLLLPRSTDSLCLIEPSTWISLLPGSGRHLEVTNGPSTTILKRLERDIRDKGYPLSHDVTKFLARPDDFMRTDISSRRIFILADGALLSPFPSGVRCRWWRRVRQEAPPLLAGTTPKLREVVSFVWTVQSSTAPSPETLAQIPSNDCFVECCFTTRAITLPTSDDSSWPTLSEASELDLRKFEKTYGILWIMTNLEDSKATGSSLGSRTFFSTSEYAQVPPSAAALLVPLVKQLLYAWDYTLRAAENRLSNKRTELLRANGRNPRLIRDLLGDAQLWDLMGRSCRKQIAELTAFQNIYKSKSWTALREKSFKGEEQVNDDVQPFADEIGRLEKAHSQGLKNLREASQNLIELEFNLTSIVEAQRSTSTNKSMKRLSWITFVFLPLMFIASLFGMNIDILASNPPWWLYIPFAIGTTSLTLAVWLIFKHNAELEGSIERGFNRLTKRQAQQDIENGRRRSLSPRQKTAMFSIFG